MIPDLLPLFPSQKVPAQPLVIAGPCSAETEEQVLDTARAIARRGVRLFRAGLWKPRTKPGSFEGVGAEGAAWLQRVRQETGMLVMTEVANAAHVEICLSHHIDALWIGARTTTDPFAVQEIAEALRGTDIPVFVKNPINPDLELWIGAIERLSRVGVRRLAAIHRGFSDYREQKAYRNPPRWHIPVALRRRLPQLPLLCDPSHISGKRQLIGPLCQQAMDLGFDGLMIECHRDPDAAWSDAPQQVTPDMLHHILSLLVIRRQEEGHDATLLGLRQKIDEIDDRLLELLAQRFAVSQEIGALKKEQSLSVLQTTRYQDILKRHGGVAGLSDDFVRRLFELVHTESIRQQMNIINNDKPITQ